MEKHIKPKNMNLLKYIPKAVSAVNFHNPPFSPGRDKRAAEHLHKLKLHAGGKGFSGPIMTMFPDEIRKKPNNGSGFESQEPTSPKISCMGQIKQKKKMCKTSRVSHQDTKPLVVSSPREAVKKHSKKITRFFSFKPHRKSDASSEDGIRPSFGDLRAPSIGQLKRFASGRDHGLANFDWTAHQIAPTDQRECYSDEERRYSDDDEEDEDVKIPFSAPLAMGSVDVGLRPRKEVNLWKRRTMNPPRPLQLN